MCPPPASWPASCRNPPTAIEQTERTRRPPCGLCRRRTQGVYIATGEGMAFTAFVSDLYSRRIAGWCTASSMPTELPLDALEVLEPADASGAATRPLR